MGGAWAEAVMYYAVPIHKSLTVFTVGFSFLPAKLKHGSFREGGDDLERRPGARAATHLLRTQGHVEPELHPASRQLRCDGGYGSKRSGVGRKSRTSILALQRLGLRWFALQIE